MQESRLSRRVSELALILLASAVPECAIAQPTEPPAVAVPAAPAAEARAREILALIDAGSAAQISAFARDAFDPSARLSGPGPNASPAALIAKLRHESGGATLDRVRVVAPNEVAMRYRNRSTGRISAFALTVSESAPHRIVAFGPRRATPAAAEQTSGEERATRLATMLDRLSANDAFSGVVMIGKGEETIFAKAVGLADRKARIPNRLETKFNLASGNKMFTAIAAAQLVEAGKLSWEDPLAKFAPDFVDGGERIKLKHLLTHTSGLGSYFNPAFFQSPMTRFQSLASYLKVAKDGVPLAFEPGSRWSYSNTGMLLAGRMVEIASSEDYEAYMRRHVFGPAGMTKTGAFAADQPTVDMARPYEADFEAGRPQFIDMSARMPVRGSPAGGGYATAPDLLRFARALLTGKLVRPETLALMLAAKPELASERSGYGFTINRFGTPGRDIVGHNGDSPGVCAAFDIVRDAGHEPIVVVVLANSSMGSCHTVVEAIEEMFGPEPKARGARRLGAPARESH